MSIQKILKNNDSFCDFLPKNTKIYLPNGNNAIFVIENIPTTRTIKVYGYPYKIKLPYVQFIAYVRKSKSYSLGLLKQVVSTEPLSFKTQLYRSPLPNIGWRDQTVCLGKNYCAKHCRDLIEKALFSYWNSEFNEDMGLAYRNKDHILDYFAKWEQSGDFPHKLQPIEKLGTYIRIDPKVEYRHLFKKYYPEVIKMIEEQNA